MSAQEFWLTRPDVQTKHVPSGDDSETGRFALSRISYILETMLSGNLDNAFLCFEGRKSKAV